MPSYDLTEKAKEQAKALAPWREDVPWWVILIQGLIVLGAGLLVLLNPGTSAVNGAVVATSALAVLGAMQFWWLFRGRFGESSNHWAAARGGIGLFAGLLLLFFYFGSTVLPAAIGLTILGVAGLVWGVLGLLMIMGTARGRRMGLAIDSAIFGIVGAAALYVTFQGPTVGPAIVTQVTQMIAWILILGGAVLALVSFVRNREAASKVAPPA